MVALIALVAWAVDPLQAVAELEWERAQPEALAPYAASAEPEIRRVAARALGRLRTTQAVPLLTQLLGDQDPGVRTAAAEALGYTPGGARAVRDRLGELPPVRGLAARRQQSERLALILALGHIGEQNDVGQLAAALAEPWPASGAAAESLGRFARRGLEASDAVQALLEAVHRADPRLQESAAWALSRIGLAEADAHWVSQLRQQAVEASRPETRAWLLKAVFPALPQGERLALFEAAMEDRHRLVRAIALEQLQSGDVPASKVTPWVKHADSWLSSNAVRALGRLGGDEAEAALRDELGVDAWRELTAVEALREAGAPIDTGPVHDRTLPARLRAARVGALDDLQSLKELALADDQALVRTAAVARILEAEDVDPAVATDLLGSSDVVVREAAVQLLGREETAADPRVLLTQLRVEPDPAVLTAGLAVLTSWVKARPGVLSPADPTVNEVLLRSGQHASALVRRAAEPLAKALGLELAPRKSDERTVEVVLPGGDTAQISGAYPPVGEISRLASALVTTSAGSFRIALRPDVAPRAVLNFAKLAEADYFDGLPFHRLVPGFVIQGGCPRGDGWGGPGWTIPDEVSLLPYAAGAVGMARSGRDTGGSQWFVSTAPTPHLAGDYTLFGYVDQGLQVVQRLGRGDHVEDVLIERVD